MLSDLLAPNLQVLIAGTIAARHRDERAHWYAGSGNHFWTLLHEAGLTPRLLTADDDHLLPSLGIGLIDLVRVSPPDSTDVVWDLRAFHRAVRRSRPSVVAFVSKTAAASYARAAGERAPRGYGELSWHVVGVPAFVLPGPSGANNGMHLPLRIALWRDLTDFLETRAGPATSAR